MNSNRSPHQGHTATRCATALAVAIAFWSIGGLNTAHADAPPPTPTASAQTNLIDNSSFELADASRPDRPTHWTTLEGWPNKYATSGGHNGPRYVGSALAGRETGADCDLPNANWLTEGNIPVDAHKTYAFSFWTRAILLTPTAHDMPVAGFQFFDAGGSAIGTATTDRGPVDIAEWTMFTYDLGTAGLAWPAATASIRINLGGAGWDYGAKCVPQQVYALQAFDDISFAERGVVLPSTGLTTPANYHWHPLSEAAMVLLMGFVAALAGLLRWRKGAITAFGASHENE